MPCAQRAHKQEYSLATEVGDLSAVLKDSGSKRVIGHSGVSPSDFIPEFERLTAAGDTIDANDPPSGWAGVDAATRFDIGERSPAYYAPIAKELVAAMPNPTIEMVPRQGHDGIARAPKALVGSVAKFLT